MSKRPNNWIDRPDAREIFLQSVDRSGGPGACWPWTGARSRLGYGLVSVHSRPQKAHRVAYRLFVGPIPRRKGILHHCDNPPCCNWERCLYPGTQRRNARDAQRRHRYHYGADHWTHRMPERLARGERHRSQTHPESVASGDAHWTHRDPERARRNAAALRGRGPKGEAHPQSKLTPAIVVEARARYAAGAFIQRLARDYSVSRNTMRDVLRKVTWRHL